MILETLSEIGPTNFAPVLDHISPIFPDISFNFSMIFSVGIFSINFFPSSPTFVTIFVTVPPTKDIIFSPIDRAVETIFLAKFANLGIISSIGIISAEAKFEKLSFNGPILLPIPEKISGTFDIPCPNFPTVSTAFPMPPVTSPTAPLTLSYAVITSRIFGITPAMSELSVSNDTPVFDNDSANWANMVFAFVTIFPILSTMPVMSSNALFVFSSAMLSSFLD